MATAFIESTRAPRESASSHSPLGPGVASVRLYALIRRLAGPRCNVLIQGETGTGKNVVARLLHTLSDRAEEPFVHVDCAALAPSLVESELFGHERGAFTGASQERIGRFELAGEGTILLDEIGELTSPLQAKLLRVLEEREFERVGGHRTRLLRARVLAATHVDLAAAVRAGRFRADLYYRLRVARLRIAPLRERVDDLGFLLAQACRRVSDEFGIEAPAFDRGALARLRRHRWPGNVRELFNVVESVSIARPGVRLAESDLDGFVDDEWPSAPALPPDAPPDPGGVGGVEALASVVEACGGNLTHAARRLGIPRSTLRYRLGRSRRRVEEPLQLSLPGLETVAGLRSGHGQEAGSRPATSRRRAIAVSTDL